MPLSWVIGGFLLSFGDDVSCIFYDLVELHCCLCIWSSRHHLKSLLVAPNGLFCLLVLLYLAFICLSMGTAASTLDLFYRRVLKILCPLQVLQLTSLATGNFSFVFQKVALSLKCVVSPLHTYPSVFSDSNTFTIQAFIADLGASTRSQLQGGWSYGSSTRGVGDACWLDGEIFRRGSLRGLWEAFLLKSWTGSVGTLFL